MKNLTEVRIGPKRAETGQACMKSNIFSPPSCLQQVQKKATDSSSSGLKSLVFQRAYVANTSIKVKLPYDIIPSSFCSVSPKLIAVFFT